MTDLTQPSHKPRRLTLDDLEALDARDLVDILLRLEATPDPDPAALDDDEDDTPAFQRDLERQERAKLRRRARVLHLMTLVRVALDDLRLKVWVDSSDHVRVRYHRTHPTRLLLLRGLLQQRVAQIPGAALVEARTGALTSMTTHERLYYVDLVVRLDEVAWLECVRAVRLAAFPAYQRPEAALVLPQGA